MSQLVCCLTADEELLEGDPDLFNCETCQVRQAREQLSTSNLGAFEVFDLLARRVVVDFQLSPLVFDAVRLRLTKENAVLLIEQLDLIYEAKCPRKAPRGQ